MTDTLETRVVLVWGVGNAGMAKLYVMYVQWLINVHDYVLLSVIICAILCM